MDAGERDEKVIAAQADVANPKRIYFLQQEVKNLQLSKLSAALPILLDLEISLKQGADPTATLQTSAIALCHLCK